MHKTKRDPSREKNIGVDLFLDSELKPKQLADAISKSLPSEYTLQMLSNRGTQVWPTGSTLTECVNHYRARVIKKDMSNTEVAELLGVAQKVAKNSVRVCSLEMLLQIDGKDLFTKAQGQ